MQKADTLNKCQNYSVLYKKKCPPLSLGNAYTPQTETASATLSKEGTVWVGKARKKSNSTTAL